MNIVYLKYAIEVARAGSINKASENLGMAQPNISRAIKDLEADLGITVFDRSAKGMNLTPEGKELIDCAQKLLLQLNELEARFKGGYASRQRFSVSTTRAGYIADAFAKFSDGISEGSAEFTFKEAGALGTVKNVVSADCRLGIVRLEANADEFFRSVAEEKSLVCRDIAEFELAVVVSKDSSLAGRESVFESDLAEKIQITHKDPYAATVSFSDSQKEELFESSNRCIYILDTAAQLELLSENKETFMRMSPAPKKLLERYGLVQLNCVDDNRKYKDILIYRKDYKLTEPDNLFIELVMQAASECF